VTQIYLPAVQSVEGKVTTSNVEFAYFLADEDGSFEHVNAALLASTQVSFASIVGLFCLYSRSLLSMLTPLFWPVPRCLSHIVSHHHT
jgi:hypothetical protein